MTGAGVNGRPLRIGLNLLHVVPHAGGSSTYSRELIPALLAAEPGTRITAFVSRELPDSFRAQPWSAEVDWVRYPVNVTHGPPGNFAALMAVQWGAMPWTGERRRLDVVHGLANVAPLFSARVARVVTLLDLIWMRDLKALELRALVGMRMIAPLTARRAHRVIAISDAARTDIHRTLGIPLERIVRTHLGIRVSGDAPAMPAPALRERLDLADAPVVLCVAQKRTHKNLLGLVRAFAALRDERALLVLVGAHTPHEDELRAEAERLGLAARLRWPGWLEDEELEGLYRLADCFALPSFEEGFGLPILEAMARGVPVACSDTSSLPEVAGDAAELFDPGDPASIAAAIDRLLGDPALRERRKREGRARAATFTWERTARETLAVYREAIEAVRRR